MPLRALLLTSEQPSISPSPSISATPSTNAKGKHIPSPLNLTSSSKLSAVLGALSPALVTSPSGGQSGKLDKGGHANAEELSVPDFEDIQDILSGRTDLGWPFDLPDKPLPSPPVTPKELSQDVDPPTSNRSSNQTYQTSLTLPSTSGSSRSGSTECPSPPLSPSLVSLTTSPHTIPSSLPVSPLNLVKKSPVGSTALIKSGAKGRPLLQLATTFPRVGSGVKYRISPAPSTSKSYSKGVLEGEAVVDPPCADSSEDENEDGRKTAREAVDERLRYLVETKNTLRLPDRNSRPSSPSGAKEGFGFRPLSPSKITFASPRPGSKLLKGLNRVSRFSILSIPAVPTTEVNLPPLPKLERMNSTRRHPTGKPTHLPLPVNPPPPPTTGLPPYRILSARDLLELLGDSYLASFGEGRRVNFKDAWKKRDLSKIRRKESPKGAKGRYIRLCTLPDLPEPPPILQPHADDDGFEVSAGMKRRKGRQPTVAIEDWTEKEEIKEEKEIPTVYLPNTLRDYHEPIACFACPPLSLPSGPQALPSQRKGPELSIQLPLTTIHELPDRTHLFPLAHLDSSQRASLQALGLIVYAVPRSYEGPIPPQILLDEEVVGPWASNSRMGVGLLGGGGAGGGKRVDNRSSTLSVASSVGSPLKSSFPPTSPLRLGFGRDNNTTVPIKTSTNSLGVDSNSSGSRWGWNRSSNLSVRSVGSAGEGEHDDGTLNVSRSTSPDPDAASVHTSTSLNGGSGWSASFTSLRARAQDYYASRTASPSAGSPSPSTRSLVDPETASIISAGDTPVIGESVMHLASDKKHSSSEASPSTPSVPIGTSRSFGSFFSRNNSSPSTPGSAPGMTGSFSMSALMGRSTSNSSVPTLFSLGTPNEEEEALKELREAGIVVKCLDDQGAEETVVFDLDTLKSNSGETSLEETNVNVAAGGEKKAGWGWRGRWGS